LATPALPVEPLVGEAAVELLVELHAASAAVAAQAAAYGNSFRLPVSLIAFASIRILLTTAA
jgi:hypothetical protein